MTKTEKIVFHESTNVYRFSNGKSGQLLSDIVPNDIPLVSSRKVMKTAYRTLGFQNNNAVIFGEPKQLLQNLSIHQSIEQNFEQSYKWE